MGFRKEEIENLRIKETNRPRKLDTKTVYITLKDAESAIQLFRSAAIRNNKLRISNYVAPQFFARYSALQLFTKQVRELDAELRTKVQLGNDDFILLPHSSYL